MGFVPPLNLGGFQPSPATLAQWVYQIWQYLQENPIATEEQLKEYIGTFITTSPETQAMIGAGVEEYLTENPPTAPVQSVQGKTGAVQLAYNEIVPASNAVPVYKASSTPNTNTLVGQYNIGYRLFVNTATQEIFTISPAGALSLVGRGKFDGTTVDLNSAQGDTTIAESITELKTAQATDNQNILNNRTDINKVLRTSTKTASGNGITFVFSRIYNIVTISAIAGGLVTQVAPDANMYQIPNGYRPDANLYVPAASAGVSDERWLLNTESGLITYKGTSVLEAGAEVRFSASYFCSTPFEEDYP